MNDEAPISSNPIHVILVIFDEFFQCGIIGAVVAPRTVEHLFGQPVHRFHLPACTIDVRPKTFLFLVKEEVHCRGRNEEAEAASRVTETPVGRN